MRRSTAFLIACALGLAAAAPASAATNASVVVGTAGTLCTVTLTKSSEAIGMGGVDETEFSGRTECNRAVTQTAHATVPGDGSDPMLDGGFCSGFRAVCTSGGFSRDVGEYSAPMTYRITLSAPPAQTWLGAPANCTGVGTQSLACTFTVDG